MPNLDRIRRDLEEQRNELLAQLAAVEAAIVALAGAVPREASAPAAASRPPIPEAPIPESPILESLVLEDDAVVMPTRVKPKRELTDAHKQKLVVSSRRAREINEAAKGLAREKHDDSFVPAIGKRGDGQPPRLVKRPTKR